MSNGRTAAGAGARVGSGAGRLIRAWRAMPHERRLAAYCAAGLFLTLFLPWYQRQFFVVIGGKLQPASDSQTAWGAFSFVEAAVLLVAAGVLTLLFQRAEGKAFHLPGGDGLIVMIAGLWTCALIVWRTFDNQGGSAHGQNATTYGIEWGIFVALAVAASLAYAGSRIRAAHRPEPPLPGEDDPPRGGWTSPDEPSPAGPVTRARPPIAEGGAVQAAPQRRAQPSSEGLWAGQDPPEGAPSVPGSQASPSRERRVGWLTAPPSHQQEQEASQPPTDWPAPEWPPRSSRRRRDPRPPAPEGWANPVPGDDPANPVAPEGSADPVPRGDPADPVPRGDPADPVPRGDPADPVPSGGSPKPVPADDAPTSARRNQPPPLPPSTPAAQRQTQADDQLTIPLERED